MKKVAVLQSNYIPWKGVLILFMMLMCLYFMMKFNMCHVLGKIEM